MRLEWDSYNHHKKMMERSDYSDLLEKFKVVLDSPCEIHHLESTIDADQAFYSPITAVSWLQLKEGKGQEDLDGLFKDLGPKLVKVKGINPNRPPYGPTVENPRKYFLAVGWESSQVGSQISRIIALLTHIAGS